MPITNPSLISRRNFTLCWEHWELVYSCITKITSTKWAPEEISHTARSAISNFKTNPCLLVKGRL